MNLLCQYKPSIPRAGLLPEIEQFDHPWQYFVDQSLSATRLEVFSKSLLSEEWGMSTIAGRLFCESAEARWQLAGDSFDLWLLYESTGSPQAENLTVIENPNSTDLRYYLFGTWNSTEKAFIEGNLPPRTLKYPLAGNSPNDRVFLKVREYSAGQAPHSPDLAGLAETQKIQAEKDQIQKLMAALNQPRVLAARVMGIDCGFDSLP